ncbi:signal peptidase I [Bifidobacterium sp. ESL0745]|uniref:signal peptidase I n=1 Tax=Bifidobacterium sp. ESL0745 TaxID=2983226 RepID=UPI0023F6B7F8|nr:signal peptidase I [Bifidobacterium sp. ESL0745]MDF7666207.1 signal peptidase I [Bifidobacterium sp. ESL0745]
MALDDRLSEEQRKADSHIIEVANYGVDPGPGPRSLHDNPEHADPQSPGFSFHDLLSFVVPFAVFILILALLRVFVVGVYAIPSGSMEDTIQIGDRLVTNRLSKSASKLKRGDIIVFKDPAHWLAGTDSHGSDDLIKRLIGMPGDVVECKGGGSPVTINGVAIDETSYIKSGVEPSNFAFKTKVTPGNVFVLGDNRSNSEDSRYHGDDGNGGLVPISDVRGVAMLTFWPFSRLKVFKSPHEVFANVPGASQS